MTSGSPGFPPPGTSSLAGRRVAQPYPSAFGCFLAFSTPFGTAFGDRDKGGPQAAVANRVTGLHDIDHRTFRHVGILHLIHCLMAVRIEALPKRLDPGDAVTLEHVQKLTLGDLHPIKEALE